MVSPTFVSPEIHRTDLQVKLLNFARFSIYFRKKSKEVYLLIWHGLNHDPHQIRSDYSHNGINKYKFINHTVVLYYGIPVVTREKRLRHARSDMPHATSDMLHARCYL